MTRTFATLYISRASWEEIYRRLEEVDSLDIPCCGTIDMHGIGLKMSDRPQEKISVQRYGVPEVEHETRKCIWCGALEEVVMIPPRVCEEGVKQGYTGPCQFDPEALPLHLRKLSPPEEPLPYDHEGARRLRELDGRGTE